MWRSYFSDSPDWPDTEEITAGFVYLRLHGPVKKYAGSYQGRALHHWGKRIRQ